MKTNQYVKLIGQGVILIPYEREHVLKYHSWMENEQLRELTASERLTLDEEFEMQRKWREDDDKCTFIVLSRTDLINGRSEIDSMVGDVNIFLSIDEESETVQGQSSTFLAELEVMIAEEEFRGRGFGREAVVLMIFYAIDDLRIQKFRVKIGSKNTTSLKLFESLGFEKIEFSEVFDEVTLVFDLKSKRNCEDLTELRKRFAFTKDVYVPQKD